MTAIIPSRPSTLNRVAKPISIQTGQTQFHCGGHVRRQLRRQNRNLVLVLEELKRGGPVGYFYQAGAKKHAEGCDARGQDDHAIRYPSDTVVYALDRFNDCSNGIHGTSSSGVAAQNGAAKISA
jgi:hypothetical protein